MPAIYYRFYETTSDSPKEIHDLEHKIGLDLLQLGLYQFFHLSIPEKELKFILSKGEHGKPYLHGYPHIHFNLTHCKNMVACAFDTKPVGIDCELPRKYLDSVIKKTFSNQEKCFFEKAANSNEEKQNWFFRFWTLKEAYVKMTGTGITVPLDHISFSFSGDAETYKIQCFDPEVTSFQYTFDSGHVLSLCHYSDDSSISFYEV